MRYILLTAALLAGCANPQPPNPIAPIARVNFEPLQRRVVVVKEGNTAIKKDLEETRVALDKAISDGTALTIDKDQLAIDLKAASEGLNAARAKAAQQDSNIVQLQNEKEALQTDANEKTELANKAVTRANTAEGKVYKYELQEKADEAWWGLAGVWRWTKHLGWRVIFLLVGLAIVGFLLNMFVPLARPILNTMAMFFVGLGKTIWGLIKKLLPSKRPP